MNDLSPVRNVIIQVSHGKKIFCFGEINSRTMDDRSIELVPKKIRRKIRIYINYVIK